MSDEERPVFVTRPLAEGGVTCPECAVVTNLDRHDRVPATEEIEVSESWFTLSCGHAFERATFVTTTRPDGATTTAVAGVLTTPRPTMRP